jgi:IS1 family transposase
MTVHAEVHVKLKIAVTDSWSDDCTVAQIKKQALESANGILRSHLSNTTKITMTAEPELTTIIYKS